MSIFERIMNNDRLKISIYASVITGLIAHGLIYLNVAYGGDNCITALHGNLKLDLSGTKWLQFMCYYITGKQNIPWLSGVISLFIMSVIIYMLIEILGIKLKASIWIVAGICQTSPALISSNTYGYAYVFYIALLFAVMGCYFIYNDAKPILWHDLASSISFMASAAIYGSYISVSATLLLIVLALYIIQGGDVLNTIKKGSNFLLCLCTGTGLFYVILRILMKITGQKLQQYGNESNISNIGKVVELNMLSNIKGTYGNAVEYYFKAAYTLHILNFIIMILMILSVLYYMIKFVKQKDRYRNIVFLLIIVFLIPIAMDVVQLTGGIVHILMYFSYVLPFVFAIKMFEIILAVPHKSTLINNLSWCLPVALTIVIYFGFVLSNTAYTRWINYYNSSYSLYCNIIQKVESCDGFTGHEKISIIYNQKDTSYINSVGISKYPMLQGLLNPNSDVGSTLTSFTMDGIMKNMIGTPFKTEYYKSIDDYEKTNSVDENAMREIQSIECYPSNNCTAKIGNSIVVVLSK